MLIPSKHSGYRADGARVYPKKGDAPAPDPRMSEAAMRQLDMAEQQYADYRNVDMPWMRSIAEGALGISRQNADRSAALSDYQLEQMKFNDARYRNTAIPFEDQLLADVNRFDSVGYKQSQIDAAQADVQSAFDNVQGQTMRGLMRRGVNPGSGMALATRGATDIGKATALATAANKTRMAADQVGLSTKMSMYGGMRGLAGLGATNAGLAISGVGAGNQSAGGMTGAGNSFLGANNAAAGVFNAGTSAGISGLGSYTQLGQRATEINNASDPFSTVLGAAAGVGTAWGLKKFA